MNRPYIVAALLLLAGCSADVPKQVTIEELQADRLSLSGSLVQFDACLFVDRHNMAIGNCDRQGRYLGIEFSDDDDVAEFVRIAQQEWAPGQDGVLRAHFVGKFISNEFSGVLTVTHATELPQ